MSTAVTGALKVSNNCIADLAGYAAMECYGIVGMADTHTDDDIIRLLPLKKLRRGIDVSVEDSVIRVDLHVVVEQGVNIASVAKNLQDTVHFMLREIAEVNQAKVIVHVDGLRTH
ncbi:MAG: Asp23/Gls24 family envelope stress response protein [Atopobiaceae bacterium]|nr:Asp23/Gls24 family envelope stress response protein [Atopobiaceae bacterium]